MTNQKVVRGLGLIVIGLCFGVPASHYDLGTFAQAGPGLFPLMVSSVVAVIGAVMLVQAHFETPEPMQFHVKNVALILVSLVGFVLIAKYWAMLPAILFLVFLSTLAGTDYSIARNVKISVVLIAIAFAFKNFLGLPLEML